MADFQQAIKWLEGGKVRRKKWCKTFYLALDNLSGRIFGGHLDMVPTFQYTWLMEDFKANDWEMI